MPKINCRLVRLCALLAGCLSAPQGYAASVPLVDIDPLADSGDGPNATFLGFDEESRGETWGWSFFLTEPVIVTHVAWHDENRDGLSHSHTVQIWQDQSGSASWPYVDGTPTPLLADVGNDLLAVGVEIRSGETDELIGPWRRRALPFGPLTLPAGGYVLGGTDTADSTDQIRYVGVFTDFERLNRIKDSRVIVGAPGFGDYGQAPDQFFLVDGLELGPMLFVEPIPEPGTLEAALGLAGLMSASFRRRWCVPS